jgi:hypothetical protein
MFGDHAEFDEQEEPCRLTLQVCCGLRAGSSSIRKVFRKLALLFILAKR